MSLEILREGVTRNFQTKFASLHSTATVTFENTKSVQPSGPWVHFTLIPNMRFRTQLGTNPVYRNLGVVNIMCAVPEDTGTKELNILTDAVNSAITDQIYPLSGGASVNFYGTEYRYRSILNGYYVTNLQMEYKYDEV